MNLSQLRFVQAVAETHSFSQAAEDCFVTQPTLSKGIAQLEEELGGRLFERTTRKVELTAFGRHVLPLVKGVLDARTELTQGACAYLNPQHKLLRISLSPLTDMYVLTTLLEPFRRDHPDVECVFKECYLSTQVERLDGEGVDIAVRPRQSRFPERLDHEHVTLYEDDLWYLPRSHGAGPETDTGPVTLSDIGTETFVLTGDGCGLAAVTRDLFAAHDRDPNEYRGVALSYQMLQDWAEVGIGAALLPKAKLSEQSRRRARPLVLDSGRPARVTFEAVWKRSADYPAHIRALHAYLKAAIPCLAEALVQAPLDIPNSPGYRPA